MTPKAAYLTPMLHVSDVLQSINFYRSLGLELMDFEGDPSCPDGYKVFVGQWGTAGHQRWEGERRERLAKIEE